MTTSSNRALLVVLSGIFMVVLDFFVVNVAIPSMRTDLSASSSSLEWVVAGYGLAFAAGLLTAGRLGDLFGLRRMFGIGLALFTVASLLCGIAPTAEALVAARVVQGAAGALIAPQVLALLTAMFSGPERMRAFAAYGVAMGIAGTGGQLIGGTLIRLDIAGTGWRACFLLNLPIGIAALLAIRRTLPAFSGARVGRLDWTGSVLATLGLVAVVLPLVQGRSAGWPWWTWMCFAVAAVLLVAFVAQQRRAGAGGLIDLDLFRQRNFAVGSIAVLAFYCGIASFFFVLGLYLQEGVGLDPLASGVVFAALGTGYVAGSMAPPKLVDRLGSWTLAIGCLDMGIGLIMLRLIAPSVSGAAESAWLVVPLLINGLGMGLAMPRLAGTVLANVAPSSAGAASGLLNTAQQVGSSLGVAVLGIVYFGRATDGVVAGFDASLVWLIGACAVAAMLCRWLTRPAASPVVAGEPVFDAAG